MRYFQILGLKYSTFVVLVLRCFLCVDAISINLCALIQIFLLQTVMTLSVVKVKEKRLVVPVVLITAVVVCLFILDRQKTDVRGSFPAFWGSNVEDVIEKIAEDEVKRIEIGQYFRTRMVRHRLIRRRNHCPNCFSLFPVSNLSLDNACTVTRNSSCILGPNFIFPSKIYRIICSNTGLGSPEWSIILQFFWISFLIMAPPPCSQVVEQFPPIPQI